MSVLDFPDLLHPCSAEAYEEMVASGAFEGKRIELLEVAHTSRHRDVTIKSRIYPRAVAEYWVVDLDAEQVVVNREPGPDGYRDITRHGRDAAIAPHGLDLEPLPFDELLDAAR